MPEDDIKLGQVGDLDLKFSKGMASVSLSVAVPGDVGMSASANINVDSTVLLSKLFAAIEAKSPPGVVLIEDSVKSIVLAAVQAIQ